MQITLTLKRTSPPGTNVGWCKGRDDWDGDPIEWICNKGLCRVMQVPKRATKLQFVFTKRAPKHGQAWGVALIERFGVFGKYNDVQVTKYKGTLMIEATDMIRQAVEKGYRFVSVYNVS